VRELAFVMELLSLKELLSVQELPFAKELSLQRSPYLLQSDLEPALDSAAPPEW
jgi:hypothetical protein